MRIYILFPLLLALAGCKKGAKTATERKIFVEKPAPSFMWRKSSIYFESGPSFTCLSRCWISFRPPLNQEPVLQVRVRGIPVGSTIVAGKQTFKVEKRNAGGPLTVGEIHVGDRLGDVGLGPLVYGKLSFPRRYKPHPFDLGISLTIKMPGIKPIESRLAPVDLAGVVTRALGRIAERPLAFGEKGAAAKTTVIVRKRTRYLKTLGGPRTLRDVRWVAVVDDVKGGASLRCRGYRSSRGRRRTVLVPRKDANVAIYERASGKKVGEKTFLSKGARCPSMNIGTVARAARVPPAPIVKWVKKELASL